MADTPLPGAALVRLAVRADGRRQATQPVVDQATLAALPPCTIVLEHAGPAASRWSVDRAVATDDVQDPVSHRRAAALDDDAWAALVADFAAAARTARAAGHRVAVAVDEDGLLHQALSPLLTPSRPDRVLEVIAACAPCDLVLTIEDLAPGGLQPSDGVAFAQRAVALAGGTELIATGGTAWLAPLSERTKGRSTDHRGLGLATAAWCVGRVEGVELHGVVRGDVSDDVTMATARRVGLAGVVRRA